MSASLTISLYDDWRVRREKLPADSGEQTVVMQAQLLDYLLARYKSDPEAQHPARFPLSTACVVNRRALVVHHHLSSIRPAGTKTAGEVRDRVSKIVDRMWPADEARATNSADNIRLPNSGGAAGATLGSISILSRVQFCLRSAAHEFQRMFRKRPRAPMNQRKLRKLFAKLAKPDCRNVSLLTRLLETGHPKITLLAINIWADRVREHSNDELTQYLRYVVERATTDQELDRLRSLLDDDNPQLRLAAIDALANCGTLDDVSLLSDLLSLPWHPQEHNDERNHLVSAIQKIIARAAGEQNEAGAQFANNRPGNRLLCRA